MSGFSVWLTGDYLNNFILLKEITNNSNMGPDILL